MSLTGKIVSLFSDKDKTIPAFPRTKVKAISDDNGVGLDAILNNISSIGVEETDNEVKTLYTDTSKTQSLYPKTKIEAVIDDNGYNLYDVLNYIQSDVNTNLLGNLKFKAMTLNDYNALATKDDNTLYIITE